jgi:hypothetical protein
MESQMDWRENANGNWVLIDGDVTATVHSTDNGWGAIWNGATDGKTRRLKMKYQSAEEAMDIVDSAIAEGERSPRWEALESGWKKTKKGDGYYRKHRGVTISVKQAKSGCWYAVNMVGALLGRAGRTTWFPTAEQAREAVDARLGGDYNWCWTTQ